MNPQIDQKSLYTNLSFKRKIKFTLLEFFWFFRRFFIKKVNLPQDISSILFICQGNIIRSAFAEKISPQIFKKNGLQHISFASSGVRVKPGTPAPELAKQVANQYDVSLEDHVSRQLTNDLSQQFDMLLCMEHWHLKTIKKTFPQLIQKTYLLPIYNPLRYEKQRYYLTCNIPDPYGKKSENFHFAFQAIFFALKNLAETLGNNQVRNRPHSTFD